MKRKQRRTDNVVATTRKKAKKRFTWPPKAQAHIGIRNTRFTIGLVVPFLVTKPSFQRVLYPETWKVESEEKCDFYTRSNWLSERNWISSVRQGQISLTFHWRFVDSRKGRKKSVRKG